MSRKRLLYSLAPLSCMGAYTIKIAYDTSLHQNLLATTHKHKLQFSPGSADEILADSVKTGDIILFNRRWYRYHLPEALYIKCYQFLNDTDYDHVGIVVCDKYGEPSILESTFWGGYKLRPFSQRIAHSRSHQISCLPLCPRDVIEPEPGVPAHRMGPRPPRSTISPKEVRNQSLRVNVNQAVGTSSGNGNDSDSGSSSGVLGGIQSGGLAQISALLNRSNKNGCHNIQLIQAVYDHIGLTVDTNISISTNANINISTDTPEEKNGSARRKETPSMDKMNCIGYRYPNCHDLLHLSLRLVDNDRKTDERGTSNYRKFCPNLIVIRTN